MVYQSHSILTPSTLSRNVSAIRSFHKFLYREGHIDADVAGEMELPRLSHKLPVVLTVEEVEHLLEVSNGESSLEIRNYAMLEFLYATGFRVSELIHFDLEHFDLKNGFARCMGKGGRERVVPVTSRSQEAIHHHAR